jgi:hypothetical protein
VLPPGSCFVVEDILDAGSGLSIVQLVEDASMKLLKFQLPSASSSVSSSQAAASSLTSASSSSAAVGGGASRSLSDLSIPDVNLIVTAHGTDFEGYSAAITRSSFGGNVIDMLDVNDLAQMMESMGFSTHHKLVLKATFTSWKKNPDKAFEALASAKAKKLQQQEAAATQKAAAAPPPRSIVYNGNVYKSLADHDPHSRSAINENGNYFDLPSAWRICPKTPDALHVCANYPWATNALVFADGSAHFTALGPRLRKDFQPGEQVECQECLEQRGGQYGSCPAPEGFWCPPGHDVFVACCYACDVLLVRKL